MKQFAALARVSSREQEREGFSLEVQEDGLKRYAAQAGGEIVKLFRIAETASKGEQRKAFRELIAYAKKNAPFLDGLLFYKVDRAARNLFYYVELERLESEYNLPFNSVSRPYNSSKVQAETRPPLSKARSIISTAICGLVRNSIWSGTYVFFGARGRWRSLRASTTRCPATLESRAPRS